MARRTQRFTIHRPRTTFFALCLAIGQAGCQVPGQASLQTATRPPPPSGDETQLRSYAETMGVRYAANPDDKVTALYYAGALRKLTQHAQAVAVLQRLAVKQPQDMEVLGAYGKALIDAGRLQEAQTVLAHAHMPDRPDWTILSAQGSIADQLGDHAQAQSYYTTALKIAPNQPQVMSNLGLSYALQRKMPLAEATLRDAAAQPSADMRVRQNLALVLAAEGKYRDAEEVSRRDLSPIEAAENVSVIRQTIASSDSWRAVAKQSQAKQSKVAAVRKPRTTQTAANDPDRN